MSITQKDVGRKLTVFALIFVLWFCFAVVIFWWSWSSYLVKKEDYQRAQIGVQQAKRKLDDLVRKTKEINDAKRLLNDRRLSGQRRDGLKLDIANQLVTHMKQRFILNSIDIELLTPSVSNEFKTELVQVMSSQVTIKMSAATDVQLMSAVQFLLTELPGYKRIRKFLLRKQGELTDDSLVRLAKGDLVSSALLELQFEWNDLKEVAAKASP
jgi:hypothetical protein